ncbi:unnamed protein product [Chondrus crispus]|uniref:Reverse transcriptase Ty1/copia-type domain-containing protein n=1 Tax=Chondrus crispus TaxID=2769 RepID=R7QHT3_CHOCR|nr:unnamed protein product [Chondrus crispus]CDF38072.1 unnamed protein product [Chondrus crispus]|eukprot:XP_005717941.1 unnamed protein product [Chondrus crispus]
MKAGQHFDPNKTSTFMAEKTSVRTLLAMAAANQWPVQYMEITAAYLYESHDPKFPVYVRQHPRFDSSMKHAHRAGQLLGNLYGGRSAGHRYTSGLQKHLRLHGYLQCDSDPCLFTSVKANSRLLVTVSMDDFLVTASHQHLIDDLLATLQKKYTIKNLGFPTTYLGWQITRDAQGSIHVSQQQAIDTILQKHNMAECNPKTTPAPQKPNKATLNETAPVSPTLASHSRSILEDLSQQPTQANWHQLKWLLRYLKGTKAQTISYHASSPVCLQTYSDADYANAKSRKSLTGIFHTMGHSPIAWTSTPQDVVALSTCEAEYIAASHAAQQKIWLRRLLQDMQHPQKHPTPIFIDNESTIQIAENSAPTRRRKLIDVRHHHLQHHIQSANIATEHIPTVHNPADLFTEALGPIRFKELCQIIQPNGTRSPDPRAHPSSTSARTPQRPPGLTDRNSLHQMLKGAPVMDRKDRLSALQSVTRGT